MSLVDASYGSDDDDDVVGAEEEKEDDADVELPAATTRPVRREDAHTATTMIAPSSVAPFASPIIEVQSGQGGGGLRASLSPTDSAPPRLRLPDVSELLGPSASDLATTSETQKKRPGTNGSAHLMPRSKVPRGSLQPSRLAPDTAGGLLTPPQLRGRSNVATEDLDKIFSRKQRR